jgi:Mg2+/Co2+ transporter CorB
VEIAAIATLAGIFVLLLLSAFFSGSETALTAASRPRMHQLERKGQRRAGLVNRLRERRDRMIGAILLGNNLVNILASAMATSLFIAAVGEAGVVYATIAMTLLVLVFGEILPKTYAFRNADRVALRLSPILNVIITLLAPISDAIQFVIGGVLRLLGIDIRDDANWTEAIEELRGAIELHRGQDTTTRTERAMLRSILDLANVDVELVMRHRTDVEAIDADQPTAEIVSQVLDSPYTRIPLWRGEPDNIVGVLHAKVLLRALNDHRDEMESLALGEIITEPWFIPETTTLLDQLQAFRRRREHFALVVDEYGALMGIVTLEDILEEIVGEISDEHDEVLVGVRPGHDGSYLVDGGVTVRDLNRQFEWHLPDQHAATIAGLVIHEAKLIPEVGQIFMFHGFRFEVARRERNQITEVRVTPAAHHPVHTEAPADVPAAAP